MGALSVRAAGSEDEDEDDREKKEEEKDNGRGEARRERFRVIRYKTVLLSAPFRDTGQEGRRDHVIGSYL